MNKKTKNNFNYILSTIICFCIVLITQKIFFVICRYCTQMTSNIIIDPQGNIIEHTYMFLIAFIITFFLQKYKNIDFGYHFFKLNKIKKYFLIIVLLYLFFSFIDAIFGIKRVIDMDLLWWLIFQLFFSGLGEEIIFRSIPIKIFDTFINGEEKFFLINKKVKLDLSVILSSLAFAIAHISVYIGEALYSTIYALIYVFIGGAILGWFYRKTKSIWVCMIIHGIANTLMIVFPIISGIIFGV